MQTSAVEELEVEDAPSETPSIISIRLQDIIIDARKRELDSGRVAVMADSINVLGLLQPIVITKDRHLIVGRHRLGAFEKLGYAEIPAIVRDYTALDKELAEIDENLCRFDLTDMERSMQVARRKQIYGIKFPQTLDNKKRKELRDKWEAEGRPQDNPETPNFDSEDAQRDDVKPFIEDTASKTGRSTTQIRDEANLGQALLDDLTPEIRDLLAPTNVAKNKSDLKRLIEEQDAEIRYEAAKEVRESYDEWVSNGSNEKEKVKLVKLGEILNRLQKNTTETTDTGEETLHKSVQRTLKVLELSVGSPKFKEVAETWTYEGLDDIREDFFRVEKLANRGIDVLTELMEAKDKLGKGKGKQAR